MCFWRPNPTPMRAVLAAAFLRGGGGEGRRDGSPPRAGSGARCVQVTKSEPSP